ncbi:YjbH domain-containing protein [Emticicia fluvialis]|uniref:YjbH domain-containing protein n=1 Tax=Emticicia fluvialis TaxID=2974474 RepID=UPI002165A21A|nr:YjbH domain-containing protein [Emticicia fluvialis]
MKIKKALSFISFKWRFKGSSFLIFRSTVATCLFVFASQSVWAQVNLSGKSGLMYIPNATAYEDASLSFGYNYNPLKYSLRSKQRNAERVLFANLTLLPRLTITLSLLQPVTTDTKIREGLGDRQLDISYLLVKEKPRFPSVAVIISSPFMIETAMLTNVLVATKHFNLNKDLNLETTAGYGSPYILSREGDFKLNLANSNIFSNLKFQKKSDFIFNNGYLVGPFAGIKLGYRNKAGLMTEWDSQHLNVGAYLTLWKKWTVQGGLLNGDRFIFGSSIHFQLLKPKKSIAKLDETLN